MKRAITRMNEICHLFFKKNLICVSYNYYKTVDALKLLLIKKNVRVAKHLSQSNARFIF